MISVFVPHLNRHIVLGACLTPDPHAPALKFGYYMRGIKDDPSPATSDYSTAAMSVIVNIEGNDSVGDCVIAEDAHYIGVITGNANSLFSYSAQQTLDDYTLITGYNPADPSTDQGTDPVVSMNYRIQKGYKDGSKDLGYLMVDATNQAEVKTACSMFGNLKLWAALPNSWINPFPSANGFVWDADTPNPSQGHCFGSPGAYNSPIIVGPANCDGVQIMTWGLIGTLTWRGLAALCVPSAGGGAAVRVNRDWLSVASGKTPSGFAWDALIQHFDAIGGQLPVPPPDPGPPAPTPPGPAPTSAPTLAQAQAAATAALQADRFPFIARASAISQVTGALAPLWP